MGSEKEDGGGRKKVVNFPGRATASVVALVLMTQVALILMTRR